MKEKNNQNNYHAVHVYNSILYSLYLALSTNLKEMKNEGSGEKFKKTNDWWSQAPAPN